MGAVFTYRAIVFDMAVLIQNVLGDGETKLTGLVNEPLIPSIESDALIL